MRRFNIYQLCEHDLVQYCSVFVSQLFPSDMRDGFPILDLTFSDIQTHRISQEGFTTGVVCGQMGAHTSRLNGLTFLSLVFI